MTNLRISITKAEGTKRGEGWYFLLNGTVGGSKIEEVGGEDWFSSEKAAREAAKSMIKTIHFVPTLGWCS